MNDNQNIVMILIRKGQLKQFRRPVKLAQSPQINATQTSAVQALEEQERHVFERLPKQLQYGADFVAEIADDVKILKSRYGGPGKIKKEDFLVQLVDILRIHHEQLLHHVNKEGGKLDVTKHDWYNWIKETRLLKGLRESIKSVPGDIPSR